MPFVKSKERQRREAASKLCEAINARKRAKRQQREEFGTELGLGPVGRRVVDLALIARELWCETCDAALSLRFMEEESQFGLASELTIRCHSCLTMKKVPTSAKVPDLSGNFRSLFAVNLKAALGCLDSGVGHEQFNKLFSTINLPTINACTLKLAEDRIGRCVIKVADESCKKAIEEERQLTLESSASLSNSIVQSPTTPSRHSALHTSTPMVRAESSHLRSCCTPGESLEELVDITVRFDYGWDKRGSGFRYDSHSGRGSVIGEKSDKVLGYEVLSLYCAMCARGHKPEDHECMKNYEGSSKGMEPVAAVNLCVNNPNLVAANVRVKRFIGDRDSSTMAALRQFVDYDIEKLIDMNHNIKSVNNALYKSKARGFSFLKGDVINYLKRCVSYAIAQNKNNVEGVRSAILNISKHTFGEHDGCGDWCKAKSDPNYVYKYLPNQQPFTCPEWRQELEELLQKQADDAPQLAPGGSTQPNESFNHMVNTRAPKSRHYAGTLANKMRVACAVNTKNIGSEHINIVFEKLKMSPSATEFRAKLERSRIWKRSYQKKDSVKRRRLFLKNKNTWRDYTASSQTGLTYVSGMSSVMERAASAASKVASVPCYLPPPSVLLPECKLVIVDIETTGFSSSDQIIQLAAKCEEKEFSAYILPTKKVHPKASEKTGFRLQGGKLWRHQHCMPTCEAGKACADFVDFLSSCANQVILVGHGIGSFDFPRILKLLRAKGLAKEFLSLVYGLTNTIPLIQQGTVKKEDRLAKMYLKGPQWEKLVNGAHDALVDCILLDALLKHFAVGEVTLKEKVQPIHQLLQKQAALKKKMEHRPALLAMQTFGVSKIMIGKMAATGVTVEELQSEYQTHGRVGLEVCLGVQLAGKPRVTTNKSIIDCVEKYLQSV